MVQIPLVTSMTLNNASVYRPSDRDKYLCEINDNPSSCEIIAAMRQVPECYCNTCIEMHDIIIGLLINQYKFGRAA